MAINNFDSLVAGMVRGYKSIFLKFSAALVVNTYQSLWAQPTTPVGGAIPTASAVCSNALLGAFQLAPRTGLEDRVLALMEYFGTVAGNSLDVSDRLAHMGGLNATLITAQTVGVDCSLTTNNLTQRIGATNFSEVEWWMEFYAATGATATTPTFAVTFDDNSTGSAFIQNIAGATPNILPVSVAIGRRYQIVGARPIKSIQAVTLSVSTGTAGNFGVTATRKLVTVDTTQIGRKEIRDFTQLGAPLIFDQACLEMSLLPVVSGVVTFNGSFRQAVA